MDTTPCYSAQTNKPNWLNQVQKTLQTPNQAKANQTYSVMVGHL
jgi:hypothetical protein